MYFQPHDLSEKWQLKLDDDSYFAAVRMVEIKKISDKCEDNMDKMDHCELLVIM